MGRIFQRVLIAEDRPLRGAFSNQAPYISAPPMGTVFSDRG